MKTLDENTVGGRIRSSRVSAELTIKELAALAEVTPNYLGLVERGEKKVSKGLLEKIASATGTAYEWLRSGSGVRESKREIPDAQAEQIPIVYNVSPQLFLALAARTVDRQTMAAVLMTDAGTIDQIIAGKKTPYNPSWKNGFPLLAQMMDVPAIRQELRMLDIFLAEQEEAASSQMLFDALQRYANAQAGGQMEYMAQGLNDGHIQKCETEGGKELIIKLTYMTMTGQTHGDMWHFVYCPLPASVTRDSVKGFFEEQLEFSKGLRNSKVSIVTDSDAVYSKFCGCVDRYLDEHDSQEHDPYGSMSDAFPTEFSIILVNKEPWEVRGETECIDTTYREAQERADLD